MSESDDLSDFDENKQEQLIRDFEVEGKLILSNLLPKKSSFQYEVTYNDFMKWCKENKTSSMEENVLLVYFNGISKKVKPWTIWARWSMLRTTLLHRHNVNIASYQNLKTFLKNFSKSYKAKQAKHLTDSQIAKFLESADDSQYLATKTILVFGICGATRFCELVDLKITDVEDFGNYFSVSIKDSKNDYSRIFVICAPYYEIVKKYLLLRPSDISTDRFFICYEKGKCIRQVIGKHKIAEVPKVIASYLNLENSDLYTGHSLRQSSATLLSDSGASLVRVKNLDAWKSDIVAQRCIDSSIATKKQNSNGILSSVHSSSSSCPLASKKTNTVTSSCIDNNLLNVNPSSESVDRNSLTKTPLQSIENLKTSSHVENDENFNSSSAKKRKLAKPMMDEKNNIYENHGPVNFYNCENITVHFNNYSCSNS